ncbi:hypothetical protein V2J09_003699, partial [Rumex salicifolius]
NPQVTEHVKGKREEPNDITSKRVWKPSAIFKSPHKKRDINIDEKPSDAETKLYKWLIESDTETTRELIFKMGDVLGRREDFKCIAPGFSLLMNDLSIDERSCWFQNSLNDIMDKIKNFKLQDVDLAPKVDIIDNSSNATIEAKYGNISGDLVSYNCSSCIEYMQVFFDYMQV